MVATVPQSTTSGTSLTSWISSLIAGGNANGWTSFGQSNAAKGVPAAGTEKGQDIQLPVGTPIPGVAGVVQSVSNWGYGDFAVTIKDALGNLFTVGHVSPAVIVGQNIDNGQTIGYSRGLPSPISTGPHIEFRVQPKGSTLVDPVKWLQGQGITTQTQGISDAQAQVSPQATAQGQAGDISIPINVGPYSGNISFPNPFKKLLRLFWLIVGIITIIVGLWLMVEGSKE